MTVATVPQRQTQPATQTQSRKPTKRTHEMICFHMMGWATTDEVEAHLAKLKLADDEVAEKI